MQQRKVDFQNEKMYIINIRKIKHFTLLVFYRKAESNVSPSILSKIYHCRIPRNALYNSTNEGGQLTQHYSNGEGEDEKGLIHWVSKSWG